jgi:apolipoprotein N-acyltransferase
MVRMAASSLGVDVVHAAVTGRSALIGADGTIRTTTELFTEDVVQGVVRAQRSRRTLYAVAGDWLQVTAMLAAGALVIVARGSRSRFKIRPEARI